MTTELVDDFRQAALSLGGNPDEHLAAPPTLSSSLVDFKRDLRAQKRRLALLRSNEIAGLITIRRLLTEARDRADSAALRTILDEAYPRIVETNEAFLNRVTEVLADIRMIQQQIAGGSSYTGSIDRKDAKVMVKGWHEFYSALHDHTEAFVYRLMALLAEFDEEGKRGRRTLSSAEDIDAFFADLT